MLTEKIGFIGGGNMAEAMIGALIRAEVSEASKLYASDVSEERRDYLQTTYGITAADDNGRMFAECDLIVLAVKPQMMDAVLNGLVADDRYRQLKSRKLIVSIAAGIPIQKIEATLYDGIDDAAASNLPIIRVMPNTPALVLAGMCGMSANAHATENDKTLARAVLEAAGKVIEFEEPALDAVTAVSGSGPAYVFYLAEAMTAAGEALGLGPEDVAVLVTQTLDGAVQLLKNRDDSAQVLREKVTSPGGTTEAALRVMDDAGVKRNIIAAIEAACARAGELSKL